MTTSARDAILQRLRSARATARLPRVTAPRFVPAMDSEAERLLARFVTEARALAVECHLEASIADVQSRVTTLIGGASLLSWHPAELPYGLGAVAQGAVFANAPRDAQAACVVGLTGCDAAIAETGSLVMLSAPGRSRAVSLLPPFHIAVVAPEQISASMGAFFLTHHDRIARSASCTFITGPSRTADIELTLTLGIHGPGRVAVVVGPAAAAAATAAAN